MKILIVIPARFKSSELPGKPLRKIKGKELILRVIDRCKKFKNKNIKLIVATDNIKIKELVRAYGTDSIMTSKSCLTGTDRVAEVAKKIKADIYVNVQGDEPLINISDIKKIIKRKINKRKMVVCGYTTLNLDEKPENRSIPKVLVNKKDELIYISRSVIPGKKKN